MNTTSFNFYGTRRKFYLPFLLLAGTILFSSFAAAQDGAPVPQFKQAIEVNPLRLFDGSFQLSYDRKISDNWSLLFSGIGTYASEGGYGGNYLKSQEDNLAFYDNSGNWYSPSLITGFGATIQARNYLYTWSQLPAGLYAAPYLMYRKVWITNTTSYWNEGTLMQDDKIKNLDVFSGGVLLGGRIGVFKNIYSIDFNFGAGLRLAKYTDEKNFTRFKRWTSLDYSGVLPTAGISIGILK
ncbi:MAG: hypothetical protein HYY40_09335 [Bacteroidetes bacterium]|nr:hypothetical protein [Bacteroidota bacterium]